MILVKKIPIKKILMKKVMLWEQFKREISDKIITNLKNWQHTIFKSARLELQSNYSNKKGMVYFTVSS